MNSPSTDAPTPPWHSESREEIFARLKTQEAGVTEEEAQRRLEEYGPNELAEQPPTPLWIKFLKQFNELVIWILIVAAVIAGLAGDFVDTVAILAIVLLNGLIGFFQEARAEQALAALRKMSSPQAKVLRGGQLQSVPASQLVPGDRIELEAGDNIPADARLVEAFSLTVQEAALTGESTTVEKDCESQLPVDASLGDRRNMIYMGTVAAAGKATAIVVATGMQTELGHIAGLLQRQETEPTPLQRRLAELGRVLVFVCLALVAIVFALQIWRGGELLDTLLVSVSLAVAAVPEGLPAVVTLALALGLTRMARRNALVRKLPSVETLGSVTVVCSDKTGTLTRNEMTVRALVADDIEYEVTGLGYVPEGEIRRDGEPLERPAAGSSLALLLTAAARCNHASVRRDDAAAEGWKAVGDPTEAALVVVARKGQVDTSSESFKLISELPFDSQRKAMSVLVREADGNWQVFSKGAPEVILKLCSHELRGGKREPLSEERREAIAQHNAKLAAKALRVLALAYRPQSEGDRTIREENLVFLGLAGMIDPPRQEAKLAVSACHTAGIHPVMITGDHPATAEAIAREIGILQDESAVLSGRELEAIDDETLRERVAGTSVYARVSAEHKLRVVEAWQARGQVVAMTGDGVNDAPAVKAADIGIAMGITGTDVTKEASDMVLTDDNFRSIVSAIEEGRSIFDNIRNVVHYLLSCNAGEVLFMLFAAVVGWPVPLAAIQILWINLVTDGLPALALAMEPPDRQIMRRPPRPPREPVLTLHYGAAILMHGALIATVAAIGFWWVYQGNSQNVDAARTVAFCITAFAQLCFSFGCRSDRYTLPQLGLFSNPQLLGAIAISGILQVLVVSVPAIQPLFEVKVSPGDHWWLIAGLSILPVTIVESVKLLWAAFSPQSKATAEAA
jgi:Ca2+-transporting ATPase